MNNASPVVRRMRGTNSQYPVPEGEPTPTNGRPNRTNGAAPKASTPAHIGKPTRRFSCSNHNSGISGLLSAKLSMSPRSERLLALAGPSFRIAPTDSRICSRGCRVPGRDIPLLLVSISCRTGLGWGLPFPSSLCRIRRGPAFDPSLDGQTTFKIVIPLRSRSSADC